MINETLELNIIGALLIDTSLITKVCEILDEDDFQVHVCRQIFHSILDYQDDCKRWDCTVAAKVIDVDKPHKWIHDLMLSMPTTANVFLQAKELHEEGRKRRLVDSIHKSIDTLDGEDMASSIKESCTNYLAGHSMSCIRTFGEALTEAYENMSSEKGLRIDTGYSGIDRVLKGMYPGNLVLICARPGVGKSAFSLDMAVRVASNGHRVMIFSMEMLADELAERVIAQKSSVVMDKMIDKNLSNDDYKKVTDTIQKLYNLPIVICDTPNVSVPFIRARVQQTEKPELIIVDYISLMQATGRHDNRNLELGQISRDLKNLATELKIPIVALAQLNRALDDSEEPKLSSIRDSGELEQNANKVLFLWNQDKDNGVIGVSIAKNRRGKTGQAYLQFYGELMKYVEIENYSPQPKVRSTSINKPTMR